MGGGHKQGHEQKGMNEQRGDGKIKSRSRETVVETQIDPDTNATVYTDDIDDLEELLTQLEGNFSKENNDDPENENENSTLLDDELKKLMVELDQKHNNTEGYDSSDEAIEYSVQVPATE